MQTLSSAQALQTALADSPLVIVQFGSASCAPCAALKIKLDAFSAAHPEVSALYVPVEAFPEVSAQNSVFTVPTILLFAEGRESIRVSGYFGLEAFLAKVEQYIEMMA